jgi:hypothetical protein
MFYYGNILHAVVSCFMVIAVPVVLLVRSGEKSKDSFLADKVELPQRQNFGVWQTA